MRSDATSSLPQRLEDGMTSPYGSPTNESPARPFLKQWTQAALGSISCRVTYSHEINGATHLAEGVTRDFSPIECTLRGSVVPPVGSKTTLTLSLRDQYRPLSLDGTITWTAGEYFGVGLAELDDHDYKRILQWLWDVGYVDMMVW
jgi:hypothetical protein